eukprot:scaffold113831_cov55-Attheya_sp.AAC.4
MANASAKRAAAAQKSTSQWYVPLLGGVNIIYVWLRVWQGCSTWTWGHVCMSLFLWALTVVAYQGIVADSANAMHSNKGPGSHSKQLSGGASLDMLGIVLLVQFGSTLWSPRFYWLLLLIPVGFLWKLYNTFLKGNSPPSVGLSELPHQQMSQADVDAAQARRERRAEARRRKRG